MRRVLLGISKSHNCIYMVSLLLLFHTSTSAQTKLDSLLINLDAAIRKQKEFTQERLSRITKLKGLLADTKNSDASRYHLNTKLIAEYEAFRFDSALHYISANLKLAEQIGNTDKINQANLALVRLLALSGRKKEAVDVLNAIERESLSSSLLPSYYLAYRKVYGELYFYAQIRANRNSYRQLFSAYTDSLLSVLDPNSELYLSTFENTLLDKKKLALAEKTNEKRMALSEAGTRLYSCVTFDRSLIYMVANDIEKQKEYLALSAISDIKGAIKDNASLAKLAILLFREKKIMRAHRYINFALEDALFYNSRLRFVEISNILPVISTAYEIEREKQKSKLKNSLLVISLLTAVLALAVVYIRRQMKRISVAHKSLELANSQLNEFNAKLHAANNQLTEVNNRLSEANLVKEHYIGNFLKICSNYIEKIDNYRKLVNKKIAARKVQELFNDTKSRQLIDEELNEFYQTFDSTFLHIYPNFVAALNKLLKEDQQITLKDTEHLNTELRVFALIRLGISDSSKIATLLHYSVNTIYNYRAKLKNKAAIPRDEFEARIMEIGA